MSMFDNLKSKLGIDTEADSYIDDTEDEIFAGGQGAPQQDYEQPEVKQRSNKVVTSTLPPSCRSCWSSRSVSRMLPPSRTSSTPSAPSC